MLAAMPSCCHALIASRHQSGGVDDLGNYQRTAFDTPPVTVDADQAYACHRTVPKGRTKADVDTGRADLNRLHTLNPR